MKYAMILNNMVIGVLEKDTKPYWPPDGEGNPVISKAIEKDYGIEIKMGMVYDFDRDIFETYTPKPEPEPEPEPETTEQMIEKAVKKSYDYYDGYVAGKILLNHADISGDEMISKAMAMKPVIETLAASLDDSEALKVPELFPEWLSGNTYKVKERAYFSGFLYKCLQDHNSQSDWTPDVSPSLWVRMDNPEEEWPEWRQPSGSTEAYSKGYKVSHNGGHWISDVDNNVWEPGEYGWTQQ